MMLRLLLPLLLASLLAACAAPRGPGPSPSPSRPERAGEAPLPPVVQDSNPTDGKCGHCGVVEHIERTAAGKQGDEPVLGGIVGGVLENEKDAGKASTSGFQISIRLDNGKLVTVRQRALGGVRQGLRVEIVDGRAQPLLQ